ncbi:hypothetical protein Pen01_23150 [Phytomonospora endophytica]|nr:hypothetical protein Pen01_23150 [Phytomonospora endophytica]
MMPTARTIGPQKLRVTARRRWRPVRRQAPQAKVTAAAQHTTRISPTAQRRNRPVVSPV